MWIYFYSKFASADSRGAISYLHDPQGQIIPHTNSVNISDSKILDQLQLQIGAAVGADTLVSFKECNLLREWEAKEYLERQWGISADSIVVHIADKPCTWGRYITDNKRFNSQLPHSNCIPETILARQPTNADPADILPTKMLPYYDPATGTYFTITEAEPSRRQKIDWRQPLHLAA
jgi:hypothetical protein